MLLQNLYFINIRLYLPSGDKRATRFTNRCDIGTIAVCWGSWDWTYVPRANVRIFRQATNLLGVIHFIHNILNTLRVGTTHFSATTLPVPGWDGRVRVLVRRRGNSWRHVCGSPTWCANDGLYCITIRESRPLAHSSKTY